MQRVYIALPKPQYDADVLVIQRQLNTIRATLLHNLPLVREDGLYGIETANAVRVFQQSCNILADGKLGPQTHACMLQKLREMPSIGSGPSIYSIGSTPTKPKKSVLSPFSLYDVADQFVAAVIDFNSTLKSVANSVANMKNPSSEMVFRCFRGSLVKIDPALNKMRLSLSKFNQHNEKSIISDETRRLAKTNPNSPHLNYQQQDSIRKAAQEVSKSNANMRMAGHYLKKATSAKDAILNNLKQYDFVSKISSKLKTMGLTGKVDFSKITLKGSIGIGFVYSLKDIIWDIFHIGELFDDSKSEAWLEDLRKDCYAFLDGLIVGCISMFLSQLIVAAGAALVGLTLSTGTIIVATVIIALIIGLIFSYVLNSKNISFSRFIFEDCAEFIISKIYGVSL